MKYTRMRVWPSALDDLTRKFIAKKPERLWFYDEDGYEQELDFYVSSMKPTPPGHRIELSGHDESTRKKVTVVAYITTESDMVELNFYSTG